ncbi:hypothetical protein COT49_03115 [candidate division WWE3 bacterium CG08_land_8_20_14_0_20_40_13]|uniref:Uncharacterized protein n=1 Tax=candidate division WWE3 bacterium CG08_land_8_20_14_0_20_40_13 TaxID=1975084 RepID=A0A2H0XD50_UNCKA|nr:MAG: hypothetical protein COT49_03115 [candidate division WWE3 bacterium CG08_land_8_20_14_0_20_40_13]
MGWLTNNQMNEVGLWEELVRKIRELQKECGGSDLFVEFWGENGIAVTIPTQLFDREEGFTIYLNPQSAPLRVTYGVGNGPHDPKSFGQTRDFLRHVISEVEQAICWQRVDNDKQSAFRDEQETGEDEDEELCFVDPLDVHEVWFTESPCGHHGYE